MSRRPVALGVLGMRAFSQAVGVVIRLASQLNDAFGQPIGMFLLLIGMFEELIGRQAGFEAGSHVVVALVAQVAHQLRGQRIVEQLNHGFAVGRIALGYRAILDVLARALAQGLFVTQLNVTHQGFLFVATGAP